MKKYWGARLLVATLGTLLSACTELAVDGPMMPQAEGGGFILYVSNQSVALDPVDIKVYIDGILAVNQDFYVRGQHNWIRFQFQLRGGTHRIRAVSKAGDAQKEGFFTIEKQRWCVIDFWSPQSFSIGVYDEQVYFQ